MINSTLAQSSFLTLEAEGYITAANQEMWQAKLTEAIAKISSKNYLNLLVDMSKVEFLDSAGLMSIVTAYHLAKNLGKNLSICSPTPAVKMVFELTQVEKVLNIYPTRADFERQYT